MGYEPVSVHGASSTYKPRQRARPLRRGAEDELISAAAAPKASPKPGTPLSALPESPGTISPRSQDMRSSSSVLTLSPPEPLRSPPHYHPLHVFNPAPGLVAFKRPLSYSEIDMEYHLCPLPKYPNQLEAVRSSIPMTTQRKFLSREEIIPGIMSWRKFPPASRAALSAAAPAPNTGMLRWCDPFCVDLLPTEAPPILSGLLEEDKENIVTKEVDEEEGSVSLTPNMMKAEFTLIETAPGDLRSDETGEQKPVLSFTAASPRPVTRDFREQQPELRFQAQSNELGDKVRSRLVQMKHLSHNPLLILH
ncbi:cilia- and flagella-associated protein 221 [Ascaphus truei]|uniref:cilia- and flagella-associated protein 221 n=1 Tax=Ascaphus truei TaxID=8439 RepID=UPI003F5A3E8A